MSIVNYEKCLIKILTWNCQLKNLFRNLSRILNVIRIKLKLIENSDLNISCN